MNNEKEIERMGKIVYDNYLDSRSCARELSAQGIGDKKQAVKGFAERLKELKIHFCLYQECADRFDMTIDNLITELYGADK